jgi:hypothetical protein
MKDEIKALKAAYSQKKANAKRRGIEWQFTFESWIAFWGDDIGRRGRGHDKLCMQRMHDKGPYHPDNVINGYQRKNAKTAGTIRHFDNLSERRRVKQTDEDWQVMRDAFYPLEVA